MDGFMGQVNTPIKASSFFDTGIVYYKVLQIDLKIWGGVLGQSSVKQESLPGHHSEIWLFLVNTTHR